MKNVRCPKRVNKNSRRIDVLAAFRKDPSATVRELARKVRMTVSAVHYHLNNLEREGLIAGVNHQRGSHGRGEDGRYIKGQRVAVKKGRRHDSESDLQMRINIIVERDREMMHAGDVT